MIGMEFASGFLFGVAFSESISLSVRHAMWQTSEFMSVVLFENRFRAIVTLAMIAVSLAFAKLGHSSEAKQRTHNQPVPRWRWFQLCNYLAIFVFILSSCVMLNQRNRAVHLNGKAVSFDGSASGGGRPDLVGRSIMMLAGTMAFLSLGYMLAFFGVSFIQPEVEMEFGEPEDNKGDHVEESVRSLDEANPVYSIRAQVDCCSPRPTFRKEPRLHSALGNSSERTPRAVKSVPVAQPILHALELKNFAEDTDDEEDLSVDRSDVEAHLTKMCRPHFGNKIRKKWIAKMRFRKHKQASVVDGEYENEVLGHFLDIKQPETKQSQIKQQPECVDAASVFKCKKATNVELSAFSEQALQVQNRMFPLILRMAGGDDWQLKLDDKRKGVQVSNRLVEGSGWAALRARTLVPCAPEVLRDLLTSATNAPVYDEMLDLLGVLNSSLGQDSSGASGGESGSGGDGMLVKGLELRWARYKGVWPTSPRDFVVLSGCITLAEARARGWVVAARGWLGVHNNEGVDTDPERSYIISSRSADELMPLMTPAGTGDSEASKTRKLLAASEAKKACVRGKLHVSGYLIRPVPAPSTGATGGGEWTEVTLVAHSELGGSLPSALINRFAVAAPAKMLQTIKLMAVERGGKK